MIVLLMIALGLEHANGAGPGLPTSVLPDCDVGEARRRSSGKQLTAGDWA